MSFNWNDYLLLSQVLNDNPITEDITGAKRRTAVSRAYYAVFNLSKQCLMNYCGIDFDSPDIINLKKKLHGGEHEITYKLLQTSDSILVRTGGMHLRSLRDDRVEADYKDSNQNPSKDDVEKCVIMSYDIVASLEELQKGKAFISLTELLKL